jgi:hypothetical protein
MQHEGFAILARQCIDDLLVLAGAERGDDDCLGFAAGEQRRAVGAWQEADTIGRMVLVSRPSMRTPVSRIWPRTMSDSRLLKIFPASWRSWPLSVSDDSVSISFCLACDSFSWRFCLTRSL